MTWVLISLQKLFIVTELACGFHHFFRENAEIVPQNINSYLAVQDIPHD
jgi:hypothetical protein